ncbi:hypothetical protein ACP4OV_001211 [Aristida adscensionis]
MMPERDQAQPSRDGQKPKTPEAGAAPDGAITGKGVEKEKDKVPDEKHNNDVPTAPAAPAEELVISVPVHCDGCARKLRRSLLRTDVIGEVEVDSRSNTVVMRGRKVMQSATEMVKIVERKTGEKAVLLSPSPEKLSAVKGEKIEEGAVDENVTKEDIAEEQLMEMVVVLRMNLHCDACCEEIKRRILKIKGAGVEDAVPQLKSSQILVKGVVEPATLVGFIHKCTGKKAAITRAEPLRLLTSSNSPPPQPTTPPMDVLPVTESEPKQQDPSDNLEAKPNGAKQEKNGGVQKENTAGGGDADSNEKGSTETPNDGHRVEEHGTNDEVPDNASHEVAEKNHKNDHLFSAALPAEVVTIAPEMALHTLNPYYYSYITYPTHPYHYQYPQPYPYAACNPATYGYEYGCPHYSPAFSEENPNACTIM